MVTIIFFVILGLVVSVKLFWMEFGVSDFIDYILGTLMSILFGVLFGLIGVMFAYALPMKTAEKTETYKIVSIQDNNLVSGRFCLGSGVIDGKMKYAFYYETADGYRIQQVDVDKAVIKNDSILHVVCHKQESTNAMINLFAIDDLESMTRYTIYAPQGTIKQNFVLDAQ